MKSPSSTVRLAQLLKASGSPEAAILWVSPKKDKRFQSAVTEGRVVTIKQETVGAKKDFGMVGFHQEPNVSYWIFPKPLDAFQGKRIVGIDYSVLKSPPVEDPVEVEPRKSEPARRPKPAKPARLPKPPKPAVTPPRFKVSLRCVATLDLALEVEAANAREAEAKALAKAQAEAVPFPEDARQWKARQVTRLKDRPRGASSSETN